MLQTGSVASLVIVNCVLARCGAGRGDCLKPCDETFYQYGSGGPMDTIYANWPDEPFRTS